MSSGTPRRVRWPGPTEFVEQLLRYTIRNVAIVAPVQGVLDHWDAMPAA